MSVEGTGFAAKICLDLRRIELMHLTGLGRSLTPKPRRSRTSHRCRPSCAQRATAERLREGCTYLPETDDGSLLFSAVCTRWPAHGMVVSNVLAAAADSDHCKAARATITPVVAPAPTFAAKTT